MIELKKYIIVYTSASRPDFFKLSYESFKRHLFISPQISREIVNWAIEQPDFSNLSYESFKRHLNIKDGYTTPICLHEDFCNEKRSREIVNWAIDQNCFYTIQSNPRIGLIGSCMKMLDHARQHKIDFVLRLCDDFIFTKNVNIKSLIDIMSENKNVNQIIFNKRPNNSKKGKFIKKEVVFNNQKLTVSPRWSSLNSIWRVDFIYPYFLECWNRIKNTPSQFNPWRELDFTLFKNFGIIDKEIDADWVIENLGCYLYGGINDPDSHVNVHVGAGHSRVFVGK